MDTTDLFFTAMTATLFAVTFNAWRLGNERRDIALLGTIGTMGSRCGVGTACAMNL